MPDYIRISYTATTPVSAGESFSNACILASGIAPDNCSNPQLVTSSNYSNYIPTDRYEYKALVTYFKQFSGTPTNKTYVYWMGAGESVTGLAYGSGLAYKLKYGPFTSIDAVKLDPTGGSNWQSLSAFSITTNISGYIIETGAYGKYDGRISFSGVFLSGEDQGGPNFTSGGTGFSGATARAIMLASGGRMQVLAVRSGFGVAAKALVPMDIQFICPAYDVTTNTGIMGDKTGSTEDLRNCLGLAAGNRMMVAWALPKAAVVGSDMIGGEGVQYQNVRDYVGKDKNGMVIYADVATGTDGTANEDPATCLLGAVCDVPPHRSLLLRSVNIGLASRANDEDQVGWSAGNVISIFNYSELGFSADQLTYGFTLDATSPVNRINAVRCRYITEYQIKAALFTLLSSGNVRISKAGLYMIMDNINATLNRMEKLDIIDKGTREVLIPLLDGNASEWSYAKQNLKVTPIKVKWTFNGSPEMLEITEFGELI